MIFLLFVFYSFIISTKSIQVNLFCDPGFEMNKTNSFDYDSYGNS